MSICLFTLVFDFTPIYPSSLSLKTFQRPTINGLYDRTLCQFIQLPVKFTKQKVIGTIQCSNTKGNQTIYVRKT